MTIKESHAHLLTEETEKLLDNDKITSRALEDVEQNGIVFIDEIDKITSRSERSGADVSREGVQRDLLPLIEGTTVSTKHGVIKTDYILFMPLSSKTKSTFSVPKRPTYCLIKLFCV